MGISLASPAVSQAWVYAPGRQPQPYKAASYYSSNNSGYYPGNFNYGFGGYGYNSYAYPGYGYGGYGYATYGYGYGYPGYYGGFGSYPNPIFTPKGVVIQPQLSFASPFGY